MSPPASWPDDLVGHAGHVISVAYRPRDGQRLASAGEDGLVRIWDVATGRLVGEPMDHGNIVLSVAYSPDGRRIASASDDGLVKLWNAEAGQPILTAPETIAIPRGIEFSPDGKLSLPHGLQGRARHGVLDTETGRLVLKSRTAHTDAVRGVAYGPKGTRLASASGDGTVKLWNAATGQEAITLHAGRNLLARSVAFSAASDCVRLAAAYDDGTIGVWQAPRDTSRGDPLRVLIAGHQGVVYGVAYSADGQYIATASGDRTIRIWGAATGRQIFVLSGHRSQLSSTVACKQPDGTSLHSPSAARTRWSGSGTRRPAGRSVCFPGTRMTSGASRTAATAGSPQPTGSGWFGSGMRQLADFSARSPPMVRQSGAPPSAPTASACSSAAKVEPSRSGTASRIGPSPSSPGKAGDRNVYGLTFEFRRSKRIVSAGEDSTIRTWDAETGRSGTSSTCLSRCDGVAFSPDGRYITTAIGDGTIKVWDAGNDRQEPLLILYGHTSRVLGVAFSPDGRRFVSAGFDASIRVWDTTSWSQPDGNPRAASAR